MTERRDRAFDLPFDPLTMRETIAWIERALDHEGPPLQHTVLNAAKIVRASHDPFLRASIEASDIVNIDGQAVVWALRLLGHNVPERVAGIDLMSELLRRADERGLRIYFLGATENVVDRVVERVRMDLPGVVVAGRRHGYFAEADEEAIVAAIAAASVDILFVGMPTPKKEEFIHRHLDRLGVRLAMGVGGSFDVLAGLTKRAPRWLQRAGLEWAYRLAQEPRRLFKRYAVTNARFVALVLSELARRRGRRTP